MADTIGQAELSKNYPVPSETGIDAEDYHKGRKIHLEAEEGTLIPRKQREGL